MPELSTKAYRRHRKVAPRTPTAHDFYARAADVKRLATWTLIDSPELKAMAMVVSSVQDVAQEAWLALATGQAAKRDDVAFSTLVCNQTLWTLLRLFQRAKRRPDVEAIDVDEVPDITRNYNHWWGYRMMTDEEIEQVLVAMRESLEIAMRGLTYRQRAVIRLRFGLGDGHSYTLRAAGRVFGLSNELIRSVERKALRRLERCEQLKRDWGRDWGRHGEVLEADGDWVAFWRYRQEQRERDWGWRIE
jgi:RNA polymerase sigma factor (sigma-70 family)